MLTVDGADPDRKVTAGRDVIFVANDRFDYFAATHSGYEASYGIVHRRHFLFVRSHYFVIHDAILGTSEQQKLEWHLHSPLTFEQKGGSFVASQQPGLLVLPSNTQWTPSQSTALAAVGNIPRFQSLIAPISWLKFDGLGSQDHTTHFAILLYPFTGTPPQVQFRAEFSGSEARFSIIRDGHSDNVAIDQHPGAAPKIYISAEKR